MLTIVWSPTRGICLTKVMAKALAPEIAVNCIAPGMIDLGEKAAAAFMKKMARETPMRRNGKGEEIAAAALFFATAPHFITGRFCRWMRIGIVRVLCGGADTPVRRF